MMQFKNIARFFHNIFSLNFKPRLLCLGFFLYSSLIFPDVSLDQLSQSYDLESISNSFTWSRLMDLKNLDKNDIRSFFIHDHGEGFDSFEELKASISSLISQNKEHSLNFQCRFPARTIYLQSIIHEIPNLIEKDCPKYYAWTKENSIESISFIFVNGYLENPASFFGHTLLKFNTSSKRDDLFLLDSALNYGANTNNDAALPYVVRGLFGRYKASIKAENFFRISAMYQEFQMRDMWEYKLNISEYQKNLITAFTYEMLEKEYKYFFLSDNCAFRINRIIGLAVGEDPMPELPWSSPIDLLHGLHKKKLIDHFNYFPSQHTKAISSIRSLSPSERDNFYSFQNNADDLSLLSNNTKIALIEDLNFQKLKAFKNGNKEKILEVDDKRRNILLNLENHSDNHTNYVPIPPTDSNLPTLINHKIGFLNKTESQESIGYYTIGLRGSNFSLLENDGHRTRNSEFEFLSSEIAFSRFGPRVNQLTLFKILSINDRDLYLPSESSFSWGVDVGRKQINGACFPCSQNYASGTLGKGFYINPTTTVAILSHLSILDNKNKTGNLSSGLSLMIIKRNKNNNFIFKYHEKNYSEFDRWDDESYILSFEKPISKSYGLNFSLEKNRFAEEISFSYRRYY